jgi:hypothetical protein
MAMKFTNNATTTLASGITSSATSLTVSASSGSLFPTLSGSDYFYCTLASSSGAIEIIKVTARSTDTFTIVRAQDNTTASAWNSGDKVELRLVAASLNDLPKLDEANTFTGANNYGTPASITLTNGTGLPLTTGVTGILPAANGGTGTSTGYYGFKNRIINGAMVIDQRNAGASVTPTNTQYTVDRFWAWLTQASKFTTQQSSVAPPGFSNSLLVTSSSAYSVLAADYFVISQRIEGYNWADMAYGNASAQTATLSFWVRSSLTGTFGGSLENSAQNRSYPFNYTISSQNTWEQKSITIPGDTAGTWIGGTNGIGIQVNWGLGVGSNNSNTAGAWVAAGVISSTGATSVVGTSGATFYITGVQLEKGSTATSFDYRPYGTELQLCQRYYEKSYSMASIAGASTNTGKGSFNVGAAANTFWRWTQNYRVSKRADSTFTIYSTTGASGNVRLNNASDLAVSTEDAGENATAIYVSRNAGLGDFFWWQWTASAEL